MNQNLSQIFKSVKEIQPPEGLDSLILSRISEAKNKQIKRKLWLASFGLAGSAVLTVYAIAFIGADILKSDFWNIISLVFSDMLIVAENWKEFSLSLLENLPVAGIIVIIAPIVIFLWSLKIYQELKKPNLRAHFNFKMFAH